MNPNDISIIIIDNPLDQLSDSLVQLLLENAWTSGIGALDPNMPMEPYPSIPLTSLPPIIW